MSMQYDETTSYKMSHKIQQGQNQESSNWLRRGRGAATTNYFLTNMIRRVTITYRSRHDLSHRITECISLSDRSIVGTIWGK